MKFKTFNKLNKNTKIEILAKLGLLYDLTSERGQKAIKKEFRYIEPQIKEVKNKQGLYEVKKC